MPETPSPGYERELGSIGATLSGIQTTLSGLNGEIRAQRDESSAWRQGFREQLAEHAETTQNALSKLSDRATTLEADLAAHKLEDDRGRKLIWKVLLGGAGGGGSILVVWQQAKAAVVNLFR